MEEDKFLALLNGFQEDGYDFCNQCDLQVKKLTSLKVHEDGVHAGVRYSGDQCDNQFKDENRMGLHRKYFHEAVRYLCKLCD